MSHSDSSPPLNSLSRPKVNSRPADGVYGKLSRPPISEGDVLEVVLLGVVEAEAKVSAEWEAGARRKGLSQGMPRPYRVKVDVIEFRSAMYPDLRIFAEQNTQQTKAVWSYGTPINGETTCLVKVEQATADIWVEVCERQRYKSVGRSGF